MVVVTSRRTPQTTPRARRARRAQSASLLVALAVIAGAFGERFAASPSLTAASRVVASSASSAARQLGVAQPEHAAGMGEADGAIPDGTSVFDGQVPGVGRLDPALLDALRRAATDASQVGTRFVVNSGWRSPAYEDELRREAVAKYGSEAEAARWVATGTTSPHVSGDAVDLGPVDAVPWLAAHGAAYGLCPVYGNEPWHYELRPEATSQGCPALYADPSHDPRMQP
jgi:hypothetical protein